MSFLEYLDFVYVCVCVHVCVVSVWEIPHELQIIKKNYKKYA